MKRCHSLHTPIKVDYFSNLPDDVLDLICPIQVTNEPWITIPGSLFQVLQRCVRLSLLSQYHRKWWLKHSRWSRDIMQIVQECVTACHENVSLFKNMCRLADCSSVFGDAVRLYISKHAHQRDTLFFPMLHKWGNYIHRTHKKRGFRGANDTLEECYKKEPCSSELFELLLAFYNIILPDKAVIIPYVELLLPVLYDTLGQMYVYQEAEESKKDPACDIIMHHGCVINTRQLERLQLNPANNGDRPVYVLSPVNYTFYSPYKLARDMNQGRRLRIALDAVEKRF